MKQYPQHTLHWSHHLQMWQRLPWYSEVQVHLTSSSEVKSGGTHTPPFLQGHLSISGNRKALQLTEHYGMYVSVSVCEPRALWYVSNYVRMCTCVCTLQWNLSIKDTLNTCTPLYYGHYLQSQPHRAAYKSSSELGTLYKGQPAGSQWCPL